MKVAHLFLLLSLFQNLFFVSSKLPNKTLEPFTATDMHKLIRQSAPVLSNDKKYIVFSSRIWDPETGKTSTNLQYASATEETKEPTHLTPPILGQTDSNPVFSSSFPNHIFFLRTSAGATKLFYMSFPPKESEEPKALTSYPIDISNVIINQEYMMFSADMYFACTDMACTADKNKEVQARGENTYQMYTSLMVRHWDIWYTEGASSHPFYQKLKFNEDKTEIILDGEPVDMLLNIPAQSPPIEGGADQFAISNDKNLIAFSVLPVNAEMAKNTKWSIYLYNIKEGKYTDITTEEKGRCQNPQFSADSTKLAFTCMKRYGLESDQLHIRVFDIKQGAFINPGKSDDDFKPSLGGFTWYEDDKNIFLLSVVEAGHSNLYRYDFNAKENTHLKLTNDDNYYGVPTVLSLTDNTVIVDMSSFLTPTFAALVTIDTTKGESTFKVLVNLNAEKLGDFDLVEAESFTFKGGNGDDVQGWIMKPANFTEGKLYPLAFLIHGGPEGAWEPSWSFRWNPQLWASHGYAVAMINPHGSSGMGIEFQDAVRYDWGGLPYQDLMLGLDYINKTYSSWIDMERVGGCGASYGGFMVNWIQGNNDDKRFKCLVTHDGVFSTVTMFYATEELWFPLSEYCPHEEWGCKPYEEGYREGFEKFSPESRVDHWNTPHLIIHGSKDYRIPITEGISAFTALQIRGVPSRFLHFPDENHWVLKSENSIKWYDEVLGWLDKYLDN